MSTAPSLLLALLGVSTAEQAALLAIDEGQQLQAITQGQAQLPQGADRPWILKYYGLRPEQRKEVQKVLYDTLYVITEYPALPQNRDLSMAIGKILARALKADIIQPLLQAPPTRNPYGNEFDKLHYMLHRGVTEAIDNLCKANEENATLTK